MIAPSALDPALQTKRRRTILAKSKAVVVEDGQRVAGGRNKVREPYPLDLGTLTQFPCIPSFLALLTEQKKHDRVHDG